MAKAEAWCDVMVGCTLFCARSGRQHSNRTPMASMDAPIILDLLMVFPILLLLLQLRDALESTCTLATGQVIVG